MRLRISPHKVKAQVYIDREQYEKAKRGSGNFSRLVCDLVQSHLSDQESNHANR